MTISAPEIGRPSKKGLTRSARPPTGRGLGTPAPDAGYAMGIAHREVAKLSFSHEHDRHNVELGVALVAAKRAGLVGRAPMLDDVRVAMDHFGLRGAELVDEALARPFRGITHSYAAQRALVDGVDASALVPDAPAA
jgi:hypothetical protein